MWSVQHTHTSSDSETCLLTVSLSAFTFVDDLPEEPEGAESQHMDIEQKYDDPSDASESHFAREQLAVVA